MALRKTNRMTSKSSTPTQGERTVDYFDGIAHRYDALYDESTPGGLAFAIRRRRVLELFDKPGGRVLDVGCGTGVMAGELLARGCEFWGIDPSPNMVRQAEANYANETDAHFSVGAAEQIDFPDGHFDAVVCMGVLERVGDEESALRELSRVLKPGGTLIVTVPNRLSPYFIWRDYLFYPLVSVLRTVASALRGGNGDPGVIPGHRLYAAGAYAAQVARHGCDVRDVTYCGFSYVLPPMDAIFPGVATWTMRKLESWAPRGLNSTAGCIIVRAVRS